MVECMFAVTCTSFDPDNPLNGLTVGEVTESEVPAGWAKVQIKAAALNHHDLWSLKGVGLAADQLPMILGCDAAGIDEDGNEVVVHAVIASPEWVGDETLDPKRSLLSERYPGTLAEYVAVPKRNLIAKPASLSWEEAACLPTAWLTAYRMLFGKAKVRPGDRVLVQGAGGGVATALIVLARAAGCVVYVTSRDEAKQAKARELGAHVAVGSGDRLPDKMDVVMETVGAATWSHSVKSLRPGGVIVISGATSGPMPPAELTRIFFLQLEVIGSTMGSRDELESLLRFCDSSGVRPVIDSVRPLADARSAFEQMASGNVVGKLVLSV